MSGVSLRLGPLAGDGPLLSFGHFPLQGELHSAALTTHCVVIHYRLDRHPLQTFNKFSRHPLFLLLAGCATHAEGVTLILCEAPLQKKFAPAQPLVPELFRYPCRGRRLDDPSRSKV